MGIEFSHSIFDSNVTYTPSRAMGIEAAKYALARGLSLDEFTDLLQTLGFTTKEG